MKIKAWLDRVNDRYDLLGSAILFMIAVDVALLVFNFFQGLVNP